MTLSTRVILFNLFRLVSKCSRLLPYELVWTLPRALTAQAAVWAKSRVPGLQNLKITDHGGLT